MIRFNLVDKKLEIFKDEEEKSFLEITLISSTITNKFFIVTNFIENVSKNCPDFDEWFMRKVVPNLGVTREIFLAIIGKDIAGICIIKNCEQEKKICSLRVFEPYRGQGVGTALVKHALDVLKDDYPLVTVPEESLTQYKPFFRKFKFQLKDSYDGYYRLGKKEYAFNGFLEPKKTCRKKIENKDYLGVLL